MTAALTPAVDEAVRQIRAGLPDVRWKVDPDGQGGAVMLGDDLALGAPWAQPDTWIGFRIAFNYPYADIYPQFVRGDLARSDGGPIGEALNLTSFEGRPAIQISRSSPRRVPGVETALIKLLKVIAWLRNRA